MAVKINCWASEVLVLPQGRRIRGFEGARAPPEHGSAPSHCQKHPLKMKGKLDETPFQTDIQ